MFGDEAFEPAEVVHEGLDLAIFQKELTALINKWSIENTCDTPDYILAAFLVNCLKTFCFTTGKRDKWYSFEPGVS